MGVVPILFIYVNPVGVPELSVGGGPDEFAGGGLAWVGLELMGLALKSAVGVLSMKRYGILPICVPLRLLGLEIHGATVIGFDGP